MPEPVSLRALQIIRQWFAEDAPTFPVVGLDEREFTTGYLPKIAAPELYVIAVDAFTPYERESDGGIKEPLGIALTGYVQAPADEIPEGESAAVPAVPAITVTRETFLQATLNRIRAVALDGDSLEHRLRADLAAHAGSGCHDFKPVAATLRDRGEHSPLGWFVIPCEATLHYVDGAF